MANGSRPPFRWLKKRHISMINQGTTQKHVAVKVFIEPLANYFFGGDCTTRCFLDCPQFFLSRFSGMKSISSPRRSPSKGQVAGENMVITLVDHGITLVDHGDRSFSCDPTKALRFGLWLINRGDPITTYIHWDDPPSQGWWLASWFQNIVLNFQP